jgi:hypothetical protein
MKTAVNEYSKLELDPLLYPQPVQVAQKWRDMVKLPG